MFSGASCWFGLSGSVSFLCGALPVVVDWSLSSRLVSICMSSVILSIRSCMVLIESAILFWLVNELTREAPIFLMWTCVSDFIDCISVDCVSCWMFT